MTPKAPHIDDMRLEKFMDAEATFHSRKVSAKTGPEGTYGLFTAKSPYLAVAVKVGDTWIISDQTRLPNRVLVAMRGFVVKPDALIRMIWTYGPAKVMAATMAGVLEPSGQYALGKYKSAREFGLK